jgi:hypothetical protein
VNVSYRAKSIVQNNGADWFGPLNPMTPVAPPEVAGRIFDYPSGFNLVQTPRAYEAIGFPQLRALADGYDILRIIIETRKDQIARLAWNIIPRDPKQRVEGEMAERVKKVEEFFRRPDGNHFWDEWLRLVLEDLLVIDAPAIYRRRTRGGDLFGLEPIDGGTIKRIIDDWGRTPEDPLPAYQQVLKGLPAVDYTTKDIIYRPRNLRTNKVYGYSPVEQIIMTINIALRRQIFQLSYFTEGNVPEALIGVPDTWTPDQIKSFQNWFDGTLQGNTAERSRARFVPNAVGKTYIETKGGELFGKAEEWLARVCCFAFSISPAPFVTVLNRASAETAAEEAAMEGLAPLQNWVKALMDTVIIDDFGFTDLQFSWAEDDELDPSKKQLVIDGYCSSGLMTINEGRQAQGKDPYKEEVFDKPMIKTSMGWVLIAGGPIPTTAQTLMGERPPNGEEGDSSVEPLEGEGAQGNEAEDSANVQSEALNGAQVTGLLQIVTEASAGRISIETARALIVAAFPLLTSEQVDDIIRPIVVKEPEEPETKDPASVERLAKSGLPFVNPDRKKVRAAVNRLSTRIAEILEAQRDQIESFLTLGAAEKFTKADDPEWLSTLIGQLSESLQTLQDVFAAELEAVGVDTSRVALGQIGPSNADELVNQVNERARDWARRRAAELVGGAGGEVSQATRDFLRNAITQGIDDGLSAEAIASKIQSDYAFSAERARVIAETEVARANSWGAVEGYREARSTGLDVRKSWLRLNDACPVCTANEEQGVIDLDDLFQSGDDAPPAHPNCRCVIVPHVEEQD